MTTLTLAVNAGYDPDNHCPLVGAGETVEIVEEYDALRLKPTKEGRTFRKLDRYALVRKRNGNIVEIPCWATGT